MEPSGAGVIEDQGLAETRERQSGRLLLLAALVLVAILVMAVVFVANATPEPSTFTGFVTPTPVGDGFYRFAEGEALGAPWAMEVYVDGLGPGIRMLVDGRPHVNWSNAVPEGDKAYAVDGAGRFEDGHNAVVLFGTAVPAVGSIEIRVDGRPVEVVLTDPPRELGANVRIFAALVTDPDRIVITVYDRTGKVLARDDALGPAGAATPTPPEGATT